MVDKTIDLARMVDGETVDYSDGRVVFIRGDAGDKAYIVESGRIDIREGGRVIEAMRPGEIFGELALIDGDRKALGQLLDLNQMLLAGLFVSTPDIETMCGAARSAGALGAKLTGAGGGGCVVALVDGPESAEAVLAAWKQHGFDGFHTTFGAMDGATEARRPVPAMESAAS